MTTGPDLLRAAADWYRERGESDTADFLTQLAAGGIIVGMSPVGVWFNNKVYQQGEIVVRPWAQEVCTLEVDEVNDGS